MAAASAHAEGAIRRLADGSARTHARSEHQYLGTLCGQAENGDTLTWEYSSLVDCDACLAARSAAAQDRKGS